MQDLNSSVSDRSEQPVKLDSDEEHWLVWCIEKFIFFRLQFFRNRCRGNLLLIQALAPVLVLSVIALIVRGSIYNEWVIDDGGNFLRTFGVFVGVWSANHWREKSRFDDKWKYLASLYNEVLKANGPLRGVLNCALAIDVLTLGFWGHRSFGELFSLTLQDAIIECREEPREALRRLARGEMKESEAMKILEDFQKKLLKAGTNRSEQGPFAA